MSVILGDTGSTGSTGSSGISVDETNFINIYNTALPQPIICNTDFYVGGSSIVANSIQTSKSNIASGVITSNSLITYIRGGESSTSVYQTSLMYQQLGDNITHHCYIPNLNLLANNNSGLYTDSVQIQLPIVANSCYQTIGRASVEINGNINQSVVTTVSGNIVNINAIPSSLQTYGTPVIVDSANTTGLFSSLAIVNGKPAISYQNSTLGDLKFAIASDVDGNTWSTPVTVDSSVTATGLWTSLAVVNGVYPAISYNSTTSGDLMYAVSSDVNGNVGTWTLVTVDSSVASTGLYTSLAVVNGKPAISYQASTGNDLMYARSSDVNGNAGSWTSVTVDSSVATTGLWTSLAVVNGVYPAISYYDGTNTDLKYAVSSDVNGNVGTWTTITVDNAGFVGQYTSLAVVNGNPAISYYDSTNTNLKYVRAIDATGSAWGTPIILDGVSPATTVGLWTSLDIVNGYPAISYQNSGSSDLKYIRATDINGNVWGTPITIDSANNVGQYTSLAVTAGGNPAISYQDTTQGDLRYIRLSEQILNANVTAICKNIL